MGKEPGATQNRRRALVAVCLGSLCLLLCAGLVGLRLLTNLFPMTITGPSLRIEEPLGEGQSLVFSHMRLDLLRPFELYVLDDTRGIRSLSRGLAGTDIGAQWSPDGTQIAYASVKNGMPRLYLVDLDGTHRREIAPGDGYQHASRWSPDGSHLAYLEYEQTPNGPFSGSSYLCVADAAGVVKSRVQAGNVQDYVWMPDGQSLRVVLRADGVVSAVGCRIEGGCAPLVSSIEFLAAAVEISLSPDASKVAYVTPSTGVEAEAFSASLQVSTLDGSELGSVENPSIEGSMVWSPDSNQIAFVGLADDSEYTLFVVNTDGTGLRRLMSLNVGDGSGEIMPGVPAWSPDSTRLAIGSHSSPDGSAIFVMRADGTELRQLTAVTSGMFYDISWHPEE